MANNISKINLPNDSNQYDIVGKLGRGLVRATKSSTSTSTAFDLTADGITELYDGLTIWFRNDATASASGIKLNLNNLGLKNVYRSQRNTAVTTDIEANAIHLFVYESANDRWVKMEGTYTGNDNITSGQAYMYTSMVGTTARNRWQKVGRLVEVHITFTAKGTWNTTTEFASGLPAPAYGDQRFLGVNVGDGTKSLAFRFSINSNGTIVNAYSPTTPVANNTIELSATYISAT